MFKRSANMRVPSSAAPGDYLAPLRHWRNLESQPELDSSQTDGGSAQSTPWRERGRGWVVGLWLWLCGLHSSCGR